MWTRMGIGIRCPRIFAMLRIEVVRCPRVGPVMEWIQPWARGLVPHWFDSGLLLGGNLGTRRRLLGAPSLAWCGVPCMPLRCNRRC